MYEFGQYKIYASLSFEIFLNIQRACITVTTVASHTLSSNLYLKANHALSVCKYFPQRFRLWLLLCDVSNSSRSYPWTGSTLTITECSCSRPWLVECSLKYDFTCYGFSPILQYRGCCWRNATRYPMINYIRADPQSIFFTRWGLAICRGAVPLPV